MPASDAGSAVPGFPPLDSVIPALESDADVAGFMRHNLINWRTIHGSLALLRRYPHEFDPRPDYWRKIERRILVTYFAKRFDQGYRPAPALRTVAHRVFEHFERARREDRFGAVALPANHPLGWAGLRPLLVDEAKTLPTLPQYEELQRSSRRRRRATIADDYVDFLDGVADTQAPTEFEPAFFKRLRWFPYIGLEDLRQLAERQLFFAAFYGAFTSTNAYSVGGGMSFAPVLQNNSTAMLLGHLERWASGEAPHVAGFVAEGKEDRRDRSEYAPVIELFGFLNLARQPFYNSMAAAYDAFAKPEDTSVLPRVERIGERTRAFLAGQTALVDRLAAQFLERLETAPLTVPIEMENKFEPKQSRKEATGDDVSMRLATELATAAGERAKKLSPQERAATLFHLALDSVNYQRRSITIQEVAVDAPVVKDAPRVDTASETVITLPLSLTPLANDAIAYLKAGFHVLFAGAPGTGKTTLAQIVGNAWNRGLPQAAQQITVSEAPVTTVASSAWAPFHTIGGILPAEDGRFHVQRGIFMHPGGGADGVWHLREECIVLDEMNRADLDRCIGELYPLLTHSVSSVAPAGIPGVSRVDDHPRFRIIATVNDATIDDIVFPISEGLARRFVRVELDGATEDDVKQYLEAKGVGGLTERLSAALDVVADFFTLCREEDKLSEGNLGDYVGFGVGYFNLLAAWIGNQLPMSELFFERDVRAQAVEILKTSLRSATRDRGFEPIFRKLTTAPE